MTAAWIVGLILALFVALVLAWLTLDGYWRDLIAWGRGLFPMPNDAEDPRIAELLPEYSRHHARLTGAARRRRRCPTPNPQPSTKDRRYA